MSRVLLKKLQEEVRTGLFYDISETGELKVALQEFIKHKIREGVSYKTARTYLNDLIDFARYCVGTGKYIIKQKVMPVPLGDINREVIAGYFLPGKCSSHTLFKRWRTLKVFFGWLYSEELIKCSPMEKVKSPKVKETLPSVWTLEQLGSFLATFNKKDILGHRNYTIAVVLLDTGARVGEITGIRDTDIDWERQLIRVTGKTGGRLLAFSHNLICELRSWINRKQALSVKLKRESNSTRYVRLIDEAITFPSLGQGSTRWGWLIPNSVSCIIIRHAKLAGIPEDVKRGPHSLRHTAATWLAKGGVNAFMLQKYLGHSKVATSEIYTRLTHDDVVKVLDDATILKDVCKVTNGLDFDALLLKGRQGIGKS